MHSPHPSPPLPSPPTHTHQRRCSAFAKRLLQVCAAAPPSWAAGALLVLSEVLRAQPALWAGVQQAEEGADDEERFVDATDDDESGDEAAAGGSKKEKAAAKQGQKGAAAGGGAAWPREGAYDMRKR